MIPIVSQGHKSTFWDNKPKWCKPWTILLTGILIIAITFLWPQNTIVTFVVTIIISLWWFLFLYLAPALYLQEVEEIANEETNQIDQ